MAIILASASPRRQELLRNAGIPFTVRPAEIDEIPAPAEHPKAFAERMAREKAQALGAQSQEDFVLAADTVVVVDGNIFGKPENNADAARMLRLLSGRTHDVITGVCLLGKGFEVVRSECTVVHFIKLTEPEIADYVGSGEPMDKAGAYGIQGLASRWIPRIEGDYCNVVGLPIALVWKMLREHGVL
jgi:septum formation protein